MKPRCGVVWALAAAVLLAGCASHPARQSPAAATAPSASEQGQVRDNIHLEQDERYRLEHDRGPDRPPVDISQLPEPVPKVEPLSRYGNPSSYTVNDETYHVLSTAKGYEERGLASWYGKKFDGYLTSSMERYDMYKFSAASKVLPLPTYARVTNLANGKSVIVRVNDRGPFVDGRIIDLSYAAAVRIGIWPHGTGMVEVQAIDPGDPAELSPPSVVGHGNAGSGRSVWLQVGSFADDHNAQEVAARLRRAHLAPVHVSGVSVRGRHYTRVRLGPLTDAATIERVSAAIERLGLPVTPIAVD